MPSEEYYPRPVRYDLYSQDPSAQTLDLLASGSREQIRQAERAAEIKARSEENKWAAIANLPEKIGAGIQEGRKERRAQEAHMSEEQLRALQTGMTRQEMEEKQREIAQLDTPDAEGKTLRQLKTEEGRAGAKYNIGREAKEDTRYAEEQGWKGKEFGLAEKGVGLQERGVTSAEKAQEYTQKSGDREYQRSLDFHKDDMTLQREGMEIQKAGVQAARDGNAIAAQAAKARLDEINEARQEKKDALEISGVIGNINPNDQGSMAAANARLNEYISQQPPERQKQLMGLGKGILGGEAGGIKGAQRADQMIDMNTPAYQSMLADTQKAKGDADVLLGVLADASTYAKGTGALDSVEAKGARDRISASLANLKDANGQQMYAHEAENISTPLPSLTAGWNASPQARIEKTATSIIDQKILEWERNKVGLDDKFKQTREYQNADRTMQQLADMSQKMKSGQDPGNELIKNKIDIYKDPGTPPPPPAGNAGFFQKASR